MEVFAGKDGRRVAREIGDQQDYRFPNRRVAVVLVLKDDLACLIVLVLHVHAALLK